MSTDRSPPLPFITHKHSGPRRESLLHVYPVIEDNLHRWIGCRTSYVLFPRPNKKVEV